MKHLYLTLIALLSCAFLSAAELHLDDTNSYNPFGTNSYTYTPTVNGVLTIVFPAQALTGTNLGYSFKGGVYDNRGNLFSDAPTATFTGLKSGTLYTFTLDGSFDVPSSKFSASYEPDGTEGGEDKPEQTFDVTISGAQWNYMDKSHLMLEARSDSYEVCLTLPVGETIEGIVDFKELKKTSPTVTAFGSGARTYYNMVSVVKDAPLVLTASDQGAQLRLCGSVLAQGEGHLYQFNLLITGAYPEKQKKDNDEPVLALADVVFTKAKVQYDDKLFAYVISGLSTDWKYEGQVVLNLMKDGAFPAAGTYAVSDDVMRVEGMCQGGLASESDLGLGIAGSCFFLLNAGEKVLPGCWLLSSGSVEVEVASDVLTLTTQAKNSYGLDVQVQMTTADEILSALHTSVVPTSAKKVVRNGSLLILRGDAAYTIQGQPVQ